MIMDIPLWSRTRRLTRFHPAAAPKNSPNNTRSVDDASSIAVSVDSNRHVISLDNERKHRNHLHGCRLCCRRKENRSRACSETESMGEPRGGPSKFLTRFTAYQNTWVAWRVFTMKKNDARTQRCIECCCYTLSRSVKGM